MPNPAHPCNLPEYAALRARFNFTAGGCGAGTTANNNNTTRIRTYAVNGPSTDTSGIDVRLQYDFAALLGGRLSIGAEGTYLLDYKRGEFSLKDNPTLVIAAPEDRAGLHDLVAQFFSYPQLRANAFASFNLENWTFRWQTRFTEGTEAAFSSPTSAWVADPSSSTGYTQALIGKTDNYWQHDLTVRWSVTDSVTITGSVQNILDEDPSDAPSQYNYDYTNGNPLGRVFEIGAKVKF